MATAGYSGTPLAKKLGIKEGHVVHFGRNGPADIAALVAPLPDAVRIAKSVTTRTKPQSIDVVLMFAATDKALANQLQKYRPVIAKTGGLWVCWPKKASTLDSEIGDPHVRAAGLATGLVDNKVCAIDQDWSGLRFVWRVKDR